VQDVDDAQAIAFRTLCSEPVGLGVRWMRQLRPFHRSASVTSLPEALTESPTAVHADGPLHATPLSTLTRAPAGFGVRWVCHRRPFHHSANVTGIFERLT
jgi:hypothetical protein